MFDHDSLPSEYALNHPKTGAIESTLAPNVCLSFLKVSVTLLPSQKLNRIVARNGRHSFSERIKKFQTFIEGTLDIYLQTLSISKSLLLLDNVATLSVSFYLYTPRIPAWPTSGTKDFHPSMCIH